MKIDLSKLTNDEILNLESHLKNPPKVDDFLNKRPNLSYLKKINCGMAANGEIFTNSKKSFFSEIMGNFLEWRSKAKKDAISLKKELEKMKEELDSRKSNLN